MDVGSCMGSFQSDHTIPVLFCASHLVFEEERGIATLIFKSTCLRKYFFSCRNILCFFKANLPTFPSFS